MKKRTVVCIGAITLVYAGILIGKAVSTRTVHFQITSDFDGCVLYRGEGDPRHPLVVSARTATADDLLTVVRWDDASFVSGVAPLLPTIDIVAHVKADTVIDYAISALFWCDKEIVATKLEAGLRIPDAVSPP
ncbi:hypothetical protein [Actomonas aquatica]|uniref:Uncharacterized protein n=1 Tax=Actomonas aquatica TaxID=2866162 RepID=A0ABZ1CBK5_9BACT|nr:hypothetical protein [Opitutus sp. WL0086]WRQ88831.1 hypothetical protein K1X11_005400 [Opitutus sp. WL0086]